MSVFRCQTSALPVAEHPGFAGQTPEAWPVPDCSEGELAWIPWSQVDSLSLWEGDRVFLRLLREERPFFSLKLCYSGDHLTDAVLDGSPLPRG